MKPSAGNGSPISSRRAAERAPKERIAFLEEACQGDEGLRQRGRASLLTSYERSDEFSRITGLRRRSRASDGRQAPAHWLEN